MVNFPSDGIIFCMQVIAEKYEEEGDKVNCAKQMGHNGGGERTSIKRGGGNCPLVPFWGRPWRYLKGWFFGWHFVVIPRGSFSYAKKAKFIKTPLFWSIFELAKFRRKMCSYLYFHMENYPLLLKNRIDLYFWLMKKWGQIAFHTLFVFTTLRKSAWESKHYFLQSYHIIPQAFPKKTKKIGVSDIWGRGQGRYDYTPPALSTLQFHNDRETNKPITTPRLGYHGLPLFRLHPLCAAKSLAIFLSALLP